MSSILGFPRIGKNRELKKALENFWSGKCSQKELEDTAKELRKKHWEVQKNLDFVCVNDFSYYDNVLDLAYALNAKPKRFRNLNGIESYFAMARGNKNNVACEMTKWFNTNYHYVVPELSIDDEYKANVDSIKTQYNEAKALGYKPKISIIGLFSFFALSKIVDGDRKDIFKKLKSAYLDLIDEIAKLDSNVVVEFSEPIFAKGLNSDTFKDLKCIYDRDVIECIYNSIAKKGIKAIVSTFFEHSNEFSEILLKSDIYGIGLDFVYGKKNQEILESIAKSDKILYAGVIDGRNIWVANLEEKLQFLESISKILPKNRIVITSSCSLLHVPFSKDDEDKMDKEVLSWLSFAIEKIKELEVLDKAFRGDLDSNTKEFLQTNKDINTNRKNSTKTNNNTIRQRVEGYKITQREEPFEKRIKIQKQNFNLPILPTTTIGSFPQTSEIRALRQNLKKGLISKDTYNEGIKEYIKDCIRFQEEAGLDVLVHGEPERNDMVEYFGEQLEGFVFSKNAWVQSYGSRCVKPPIIYGDVKRKHPMTIEWITYAQSLSKKIVKGMLTGPVTILNWSFVRDDLARKEVCKQIALGIADEINDLQNANIKIIQVDEAAFKEGYPLRAENIKEYETWALDCFKISTAIAKSQTQIHTHMCYSDFNDIIKTIEALDADVISIETARSGNKLLKVFKQVGYKNEVGPGVYDIHSPRIPSIEEITAQIKSLLEVLPKEQLWINPDCGLKTRKWEEVRESLKNIVIAVKNIRENLA
ncbi:5-methyltetrahydropteroyltriglutamate--homocysteine S-methyltransferase [Helicobacter sp. MIT 99-5507]|uniref:5-methyltetrahydropteroyltriglutamate-- homocysteine S-methyltransferase n=1 Tax=Helicobacter sp. MIT 99-5507 TaxID=152489 RepID=UPI000E1F2A5D|nr:5-methyltetrahydropteroyltriglutamate--homocysteine S-methyltransferase [Helicobacter sp. MIT 99-5507]RDU58159.1 5-methyltetrahydropteroyltriglutamate--homocysteine S-methyltransferase [Helicobacter sp. MIT 99-5507]